MSNNIYDILKKFNSLGKQPKPQVEQQPKEKSRLQESIDTVSEKYMGFKKVAAAAKAGGAKDPDAVAAAIGRKKYGKEKFQKAAAQGKKLGEEQGSKRLSIGQQMARDGITYSVEREKELIGIIGDYLAKNGHSEKAIRYYLSYDEDFVPDTLSELPKEDVAEVAPPGAKAERMVKHIKKGYAKDGKLTDKERSIAYATAWKAHKAGKVEEAAQALQTLVAAGMTAEQITEGWDDMLKAVKKQHKDQVGTGKFDKKKVSTGTVYTRKYDADGMSNTDDEVKADGEKRGRGRPKKSAFESKSVVDKMIAEAYQAEGSPYAYRPSGSDIAGPARNTLGSQLKGLGKDLINKIAPDDKTLLRDLEKKTVGEDEDEISSREPEDMKEDEQMSYEQNSLRQAIGDDMYQEIKASMQDAKFDLMANDPLYNALYDYYTNNGEMPYGIAKARTGDPDEWIMTKMEEVFGNSSTQGPEDSDMDKELAEMMRLAGMQAETKMSEADMDEGAFKNMGIEVQEALLDFAEEIQKGMHSYDDVVDELNDMFDKVKASQDPAAIEAFKLLRTLNPEDFGPGEGGGPNRSAYVSQDAMDAINGYGDVDEGNEFTAARVAAIKAGKDSFEVDGKTYKVTGDTSDEKKMEEAVTEGEECPKCHCDPCECDDDDDKEKMDECGPGYEMDQGQEGRMNVSTNMSSDGNKSVTITADGEAAEELMQMLALAGMKARQSMPQEENVHQQMAAVEEEKDPRYQASTTPEEEVMPVQVQTKGGNGEVAGKEKKMHKDGAARFSDNPLAMKESVDDLSNMGRELMKEYEALKVQK